MTVGRGLRLRDGDAFAMDADPCAREIPPIEEQHRRRHLRPPVGRFHLIDTRSVVLLCFTRARSIGRRRGQSRTAQEHGQSSETKQPPAGFHDVASRRLKYRVAGAAERPRHGGSPRRGARQPRIRTRREAPLQARGPQATGERCSTVRSRRYCNCYPDPGSWACWSGCTPARGTLPSPAP